MTVASEGMLAKQLGGPEAEAVAKIVEANAAGSPEAAGLAARTWAKSFGDEENKAQACEWKEKDKDLGCLHQVFTRERCWHRTHAGPQGLCAEDDTC
eukprot:11922620-Heterocapsa_arctica.AAC.1